MEYSISKNKSPGEGGLGWVYIDVFTPQRMYNAEGYVDNISASISTFMTNGVLYNYFRRDHLGNNREVWNGIRKNYSGTVKGQAATRQRTQYYPSGLPWASNTIDYPSVQSHKYNDKEFIEMDGLDTYDYGARGYYPAMGRFMTMDPLAEMDCSVSPYVYCHDNPVNKTDPTGKTDLLPEGKVVVTAPRLNNNDDFYNRTLAQQLLGGNKNAQQIPIINHPSPSKLLSNANVNNASSTSNKNQKKDNGVIKTISDAIAALGISESSVEIVTKNYAGEEIVYVTLKGTDAIVQTEKILGVLKGFGAGTFVLGIGMDVTRSLLGDPKQPWSKTIINAGISYVAVVVIGGGPGLLLGAGYYIIDNTIGWQRLMTPATNDQWLPNRAVFPDGSSTYVCFKAGTKILSKKGLEQIERICIGDSVYSFNLDKNTIELNEVVKSFKRNTHGIYELTTDNQNIFVTAEHPFYIDGKGWIKVKNIQIGDVLKTKNGSIERVLNIKNESYEGPVYNVEVEGNHNYFVTSSNVLVHNK